MRTSYIKRLTAKLPKGSKAPPLSTAAELLLGALAGALAQICTIPVSVIATRQQIGNSLDRPRRKKVKVVRKPKTDVEKAIAVNGTTTATSGSDSEYSGFESGMEEVEEYDDSFLGVAREIVEEEGVSGLWLGIKPGLVLTVNPAITYGVYERVKGMMLLARQKAGNMSGKLNPWDTFMIGALSKSLATVVRSSTRCGILCVRPKSADEHLS